jgi:hypothetical protein
VQGRRDVTGTRKHSAGLVDEGQTYLRSVILEYLRAAARAITPDMSLPQLVRLLLAKLRTKESRKLSAASKCERPLTHATSLMRGKHT